MLPIFRQLSQWTKHQRDFFVEKKYRLLEKNTSPFTYIDDNMDTDTLWEKVQGAYDPIFVLSTGRCGTKLLTDILAQKPHTIVNHNIPSELISSSSQAYSSPTSESTKHLFLGAKKDLLIKSCIHGKKYIETNNRITFFAYQAAALFPNAKFIHIVRSPEAIVRSGVARDWYRDTPTKPHLHDLGRLTPPLVLRTQIEKIAWLWNETNVFIEEFKNTHKDSHQIRTVTFENLIQDPKVLQSIESFIGVPPSTKETAQKNIALPKNKQKTHTLPHYEHWTKEMKDSFQKQIPTAKTYDYHFDL